MKIELRNLRTYERMSEETNAFNADLFIDGKNVGSAKNDGRGGMTDYNFHYDADEKKMREMRDTIERAEEYCKTLPPLVYDPGEKDELSIPMTLEHFIDGIVEKSIRAKLDKKMAKAMDTHIVYGNSHSYVKISWGKQWTISKLLESDKGKEAIKKAIADLKVKHPKYKLLNNNIPAELV